MLDETETEALRRFATIFGKGWKDKLRDFWRTGADVNALPDPYGAALRRVRNKIGPSGLEKVKV